MDNEFGWALEVPGRVTDVGVAGEPRVYDGIPGAPWENAKCEACGSTLLKFRYAGLGEAHRDPDGWWRGERYVLRSLECSGCGAGRTFPREHLASE